MLRCDRLDTLCQLTTHHLAVLQHVFAISQYPPTSAPVNVTRLLSVSLHYDAPFRFFMYSSMARRISSATGAPVFADWASSFLICSSLRKRVVLFMCGMLAHMHIYT